MSSQSSLTAELIADYPARPAVQSPLQDRAIAAGVRLRAIDLLRGLVIMLMVLDHAREFFHASAYAFDPLDPAHTTPILYATRWITHFCAPTFVFLAGVSAYLQRAKGKPLGVLSGFLLKRGIWLVLLEITAISFALSFSLPYILFLQVIWAIGWGMIALAGLVWVPRRAVLSFGIIVIVGHNLLDPLTPAQFGVLAPAWTFLHEGGVWSLGGRPFALVLYPVLPWLGVMCLGYGLGPVFLSPGRDRSMAILGASLISGFLIFRAINIYGDPQLWVAGPSPGETIMNFMNVAKYPPSLLYICATLGPMLLLAPLLERRRGTFIKLLAVFGSVPLFAYLIHFFMLHKLSILVHAAAGRPVGGLFDYVGRISTDPASLSAIGFPLWVTYLAWITTLGLLYPCCRWWQAVKARRGSWWLSYL